MDAHRYSFVVFLINCPNNDACMCQTPNDPFFSHWSPQLIGFSTTKSILNVGKLHTRILKVKSFDSWIRVKQSSWCQQKIERKLCETPFCWDHLKLSLNMGYSHSSSQNMCVIAFLWKSPTFQFSSWYIFNVFQLKWVKFNLIIRIVIACTF